ncbi:MAG: hypothetical protein KKB63_15185, partial [Alphaproteobacteria bacterium]|nr:hypothetical protein [Alphaproteobacteria bacterium]
MSFLDNLKVATKVAVSSGTILVLLLVASGIAVFGLVTAQNSFADYRLLARQTNAEATVQGHLLSTQLGVQNFMRFHTEDAAQVVVEGTARALAEIDNAI